MIFKKDNDDNVAPFQLQFR